MKDLGKEKKCIIQNMVLMKVIGKKTKSMDKERNSITMEFMKVISNMIQKMEMEYFNGKMEMFITADFRQIKEKEKESTNGVKEGFTKVNGKPIE